MMDVITYVICIIMDFLIAYVVIIILLVIITILMAVYIYPKVCKGGISKENDSSSPVMFNNILLEEIISSIIMHGYGILHGSMRWRRRRRRRRTDF